MIALTSTILCLVISVTDGDTLKARCAVDGVEQVVSVRLGGIDAPEKAQPYGKLSKEALTALCDGVVATITPRSFDRRYGRTVADVECRGKDVGTEQVRTGMAWVYDRYAKGYSDLYAAQKAAQRAEVGLWAQDAPQAPWEYRKRR